MDLAARWTHCKTELAARLAREDGEAWLDALTLEHLERDRVVLGGVPNSVFRSRILTQYREALLAALAVAFPDHPVDALAQLEVRLAAAPPSGPELPAPAAAGAAAEQLPLPGLAEPAAAPVAGPVEASASSGLDPRLTLERFLAGPAMGPVLEAIAEIVRAPGLRFNPLLLCGAAGLGRTHLLHGLGHALSRRRAAAGGAASGGALSAAPLRVLCASAERFKQEVLEGMQLRRMKSVRERWQDADALLLDDLHFVLVAPRVQEELLHLFDSYVGSGRPVAFTAERLPRALRGLNETLRSRIEAGLVLELEPPDADTRLAYISRRSAEERIVLGDAEARWLAERLRGSLRVAEGVLVRLAAYGGNTGRPLTREFVEHVAAPLLAEGESWGAPVLAERIVGAVCERFGIAVKALQAPSRTPTLVRARQVTVLLLKELAGLSYPEMAPWLGQRTPSTLSHASHTLERDLARHPHVQRLVHQIREDASREPASPPPRPASGKTRRFPARRAERQ
ncbi:MAG: DnaA ATPase domain-containing protein [SAR324 cluster bacterium]